MNLTKKLRGELIKASKFATTVIGGTAWGIIFGCLGPNSDRRILTERDFNNAKWYSVYNPHLTVRDYFLKEDIYTSEQNWELYNEMVKKRNNGKITGQIIVPNLDDSNKHPNIPPRPQ